jgi:hypothetical protein
MSRQFFDFQSEKRKIHIKSPQYRGYLGLLRRKHDPSFKGNNLRFHCATELEETHPDVVARFAGRISAFRRTDFGISLFRYARTLRWGRRCSN